MGSCARGDSVAASRLCRALLRAVPRLCPSFSDGVLKAATRGVANAVLALALAGVLEAGVETVLPDFVFPRGADLGVTLSATRLLRGVSLFFSGDGLRDVLPALTRGRLGEGSLLTVLAFAARRGVRGEAVLRPEGGWFLKGRPWGVPLLLPVDMTWYSIS